MTMDIMKEVEEVQKMYKETVSNEYFRAFIYGDKGSGKTRLFKTCRRPVFIYSFDPDGVSTIRDEIAEGWIVANTMFEADDPKVPSAFEAFDKDYQRRKREGFFNYFGTVGIDSLTTLSIIIMNAVMKKGGHAGGVPVTGMKGADNDYVLQRTWLENVVRALFTLPCDVIVTGHPDLSEGNDKKKFIGPLLTGQSAVQIPLLFSEMYATQIVETSTGTKYGLLTKNDGLWRASSRLSNKGQLDKYEEPNIKEIMKKAGYNTDDKAIPWLEAAVAAKS